MRVVVTLSAAKSEAGIAGILWRRHAALIFALNALLTRPSLDRRPCTLKCSSDNRWWERAYFLVVSPFSNRS